MYHFLCTAELAFDFTTPDEGAVTPLEYEHRLGAVAAAAAHEVAAIDADARVVAGPPVRTRDTKPWVPLAETRRRLEVNQVFSAWRFVVGVVRPQLEAVAVAPRHTVRGSVVSLRRRFQVSVVEHHA